MVAVACFLPGRAKDLTALPRRRNGLGDILLKWVSLLWAGRPLFCGMCVGWDIFLGLDVLAGKFLYVGRLRFLLSTINSFFFF